jgi:thymidylate synthase ThyX
MEATEQSAFLRRVYPLDPREVTEEELAVIFAMTSRRPEAFDAIKEMVTAEKAADFHERWVLGYGHASVAEHAIIHLAVENVSRLACDTLEDNRLGSYTEKSSRYQLLERNAFYTPQELDDAPDAKAVYVAACQTMFDVYQRLVEGTIAYLATIHPQGESERDGSYKLRLRREATDSCRFVLPASALTNVGVTMNTRTLEHAVRKLLSSALQEERELGEELKEQAKTITPTLVRHAEPNDYIALSRAALEEQTASLLPEAPTADPGPRSVSARLVDYDVDAQTRLVTALLYRNAHEPYDDVWKHAQTLSAEQQEGVITAALGALGPHDSTVRELEQVEYTFEYLMDYGAYREFKRHRMQSYLPQPLTVIEGYVEPELIVASGLSATYREAMDASAGAYTQLATISPRVAEYAVTHAHLRRVVTRMNLRECYHFFKLRVQPEAHFTIRDASQQAMDVVRGVHPLLMKFINLRQS